MITTSSIGEIEKLQEKLGMSNAKVIKGDVLTRTDMFYEAKEVSQEDILNEIGNDIKHLFKEKPGLIFVMKSNDAEKTSAFLKEKGFSGKPHYAGLEQRFRNFRQWEDGDVQILVSTSESLRYGIVKILLKFIFHIQQPESLKNFYQMSK